MRDQNSAIATDSELAGRSRDVAWYQDELKEVPETARQLLEAYSQIPSDQVAEHVFAIREKAWGFRFIDLNLPSTSQYASIVHRLQQGQKLLDLGCCFGQEIRRLIFDGAPSENLYGLDLRQEFFELGYELFLDREKCKAKFFAADAFKPEAEIEELTGKMDIVYAGAFFHLFDQPEQIVLAKRAVSFMAGKKGDMILGRQVGNVNPGRYEHATNVGGWMFRHNPESWKAMWQQVGKETGTEWDVWADMREAPRFARLGFGAAGSMQMHFVVTRA